MFPITAHFVNHTHERNLGLVMLLSNSVYHCPTSHSASATVLMHTHAHTHWHGVVWTHGMAAGSQSAHVEQLFCSRSPMLLQQWGLNHPRQSWQDDNDKTTYRNCHQAKATLLHISSQNLFPPEIKHGGTSIEFILWTVFCLHSSSL